ncbi:MAG: hypothetical protein LBQ75_06240 [Zoogloeaceae bacterium]|jgi:hypothetical protein|nr:hypothetical protein [Zoogloeaceae bacterium]
MSKCEKKKVGSDSSGRPQSVEFSCHGRHFRASNIASHKERILSHIKTACEKSGGRYSLDAGNNVICGFSTTEGYAISAHSTVHSDPYTYCMGDCRHGELIKKGKYSIILNAMDNAEYQAWAQRKGEAEAQAKLEAEEQRRLRAEQRAEQREKDEAQARLQAEQREKQEIQAARTAAADWNRASASLRNSLKPGDQVYLILERKSGRTKGLLFEVPAMVISVKPPLAEVQFSEFLDVASIRRWEKSTDIYAKAPEIFFCEKLRWRSAWSTYTKIKGCLRTREEIEARERDSGR